MDSAEVVHRMVSTRTDLGWPMYCCHCDVESMPLVVERLKCTKSYYFHLFRHHPTYDLSKKMALTQWWWTIGTRNAIGQWRCVDSVTILMHCIDAIRSDGICSEQLLSDCRLWRFKTEEWWIGRMFVIRNGVIFIGTWIEITVRVRVEQKTLQFGANAWLQCIQRRTNLTLNVSWRHNWCEMLVRRLNQQLIVVIWWRNIDACKESYEEGMINKFRGRRWGSL